MSRHYAFFILFAVLEVCSSTTITKTITFTDTTQFQDISLYNFAEGLENTYEFLVTAREGKLVSLYLFQNDKEMQYKIDAYDGTNDKDPSLKVELFIQPTTYLLLTPINVTSTEQNMFIRVTVAKTSNKQPDFQAMVTDYSPQADCDFPGFSVNLKANYSTSYLLRQNAEANCIYIIHANDPTNQASVLQKIFPNIPNLGLDRVRVHKGLQTDSDHLLISTKQMASLWAYDSYLTVQQKETMGLNFGWDNTIYRDNLNNPNLQLPVVNGYENLLMTMDYLREPNPSFMASSASVITLNVISPATKVQVNFLKLGASTIITATPFVNGQQTSKPITYYGDQFKPFSATYECDQLQLLYINLDATAKDPGFYGVYEDATITLPVTTQLPGFTPDITVNANMTTTTTTVRPIQATTKAVRGSYDFFTFIVVTFVLILFGASEY